MTTAYDASPAAGSASSAGLDPAVAALKAAYERTVDAIMTSRFGSHWATRGDLPDEAYTTELVFAQWLSDLLDHIESAAAPTSQITAG